MLFFFIHKYKKTTTYQVPCIMSFSRIAFLFSQSFQFCSFLTESNGFAKVDYHQPLSFACKMHFTGKVHRADKKTRGRETANKSIHQTWKIISRIFLPQYEHTAIAQKLKFANETTLPANGTRFRLKCTMFSQIFPVHSCPEEIFWNSIHSISTKKHSVTCITDCMTLYLKEKISLTNKAIHNLLLQYLQRTLIIINLI